MKTTTIWALSVLLGLAGLTGCTQEQREGMDQDTERTGEEIERGAGQTEEDLEQGIEEEQPGTFDQHQTGD